MSGSNVTILGRFEKQPGETLDYFIDFGPWFAGKPPKIPARTDTPASFEVVAEAGITLAASTISGNVVTVVLAGGTVNVRYKVTVRLTTNAATPRVKEADFYVTIREA